MASFMVAATGTGPITYQWQRGGNPIAGATSPTYTTGPTTAQDSGATFQVMVTNPVGTTPSNTVTLTVNSPPTITAQPVNQTVPLTHTATFSVTATGVAPLSYQWLRGNSPIAGATSSSYTTAPTGAGDNNATFQVLVTNPGGTTPSNTVTLTVNSPPTITVQPTSQTVALTHTATFSVTATGVAPITYQWLRGNSPIAGATSSSYTTAPTGAGDNNATFQVLVTNPGGTTPSNTVTLTVDSPPSITVQPASKTVLVNQTATFSVTATGVAPLSYQWLRGNSPITGATSSSYTTAPTGAGDNDATFQVLVTNPGGTTPSNSATLTVDLVSNPVPVTTYRYDLGRTGQNTNEAILTPANVNSTQFGKLFSQAVDGQVYAQPLYVANLTLPGAVHNVVFVATQNDSVYAFDADSNAGANATYLWHANLIDTAHGAAPGAAVVTSGEVSCNDINPIIGVTGTPVIDPITNTLYVEAKSAENGGYVHRLHALDITTGAEKSPGPIVIDATVSGTGDGSSGGKLVFSQMAVSHQSRPALLLMNGTVYIAFASHCDNGPYHGWLFAYNASTFAQQGVFVTTPNGGLGGFWMSGAGIAADTSGNIFIATGNGTFDTTNVPATMFGDTILKLALSGSSFTVEDYFTPYDQNNLSNNDTDLGSGGVLLLPDQPGAHPHLLVQVGKEGTIYLVNRDQMTTSPQHYCSSGCSSDPEILQELQSAIGGMWASPAYWNGSVFFWGQGDVLKQYSLTNGLLSSSPVIAGMLGGGNFGYTPTVSSNGTTNGILWAIVQNGNNAILYAFDPTNVANEFYDATQAANNRDIGGGYVKFTVPVVTDGKVYVGAANELDVYGLL